MCQPARVTTVRPCCNADDLACIAAMVATDRLGVAEGRESGIRQVSFGNDCGKFRPYCEGRSAVFVAADDHSHQAIDVLVPQCRLMSVSLTFAD